MRFRAHGKHFQKQASEVSARSEAHSTPPTALPAPRPKAGTARRVHQLCPGRVPGWRDEPPGDAVLPALREGLLQGKAPPLPGPRCGRVPPVPSSYLAQGALLLRIPGPGRRSGQQRRYGRKAVSARRCPAGPSHPPRCAGTGELLDGEPVEDLEGGIELQRLAAALAHEADLRGAGGRPPALHAVPLRSAPGPHHRHHLRRT